MSRKILRYEQTPRLAMFVLLIFTTSLAYAQSQDEYSQDEYRVELIVVRNLNPVYGTEQFPMTRNNIENEYEAKRFSSMSRDQLELTSMARKLASSRNFRVVSHFAWTQPGYPRDEAKRKVVIRNASTGESVNGNVVLSKERYLRLQLDLNFLVNGSQYSMKTKRRMISRQIHYFDHPFFGVIAKITPL